MMRDCELSYMTLDQLHGVLAVLERSSDPCAPVAVRMVEREMRLKRRSIREQNGLTKRHVYGREQLRRLSSGASDSGTPAPDLARRSLR